MEIRLTAKKVPEFVNVTTSPVQVIHALRSAWKDEVNPGFDVCVSEEGGEVLVWAHRRIMDLSFPAEKLKPLTEDELEIWRSFEILERTFINLEASGS